jgi:hypothetical protein
MEDRVSAVCQSPLRPRTRRCRHRGHTRGEDILAIGRQDGIEYQISGDGVNE